MRVGPRTPDGADRLAVDLVGRDDDRAVGQRHEAVLGADGDGQPAVEHVVQQGDDHVLLLEDARAPGGRCRRRRRRPPCGPRRRRTPGRRGPARRRGSRPGLGSNRRRGRRSAGRRWRGPRTSDPTGWPTRWAERWAPAAPSWASVTSAPTSSDRFSTAPLDSTTTSRASVGARLTSCTERMVAASMGGGDRRPRRSRSGWTAGGWCHGASARARRGPGRRTPGPAGWAASSGPGVLRESTKKR